MLYFTSILGIHVHLGSSSCNNVHLGSSSCNKATGNAAFLYKLVDWWWRNKSNI